MPGRKVRLQSEELLLRSPLVRVIRAWRVFAMIFKGLFVGSLLLSSFLQAKEIALTFDDAPRGSTSYFTGRQRSKKLTAALSGYQAAFFCNTAQLNSEGLRRLNYYSRQGHILANHSHSHPDIRKISVSEYIDDIQRADAELSLLPNFYRWFRFPYLREGANERDRDAVRNYLKSTQYMNGYVTIDNYDWYIDELLQSARSSGKKIHLDKLCDTYSSILWKGIEFYDRVAISTLRRSPKHILFLHENDLAALCLDKLIDHIERKGWRIISPINAYKDPIAIVEPRTLFLNQGRVAAIAKANGYTGPLSTKWENESALEKEFSMRKVFTLVPHSQFQPARSNSFSGQIPSH